MSHTLQLKTLHKGQASAWLKLGWKTFAQQPLGFLMLFFILLVVLGLLSGIPLIGGAVNMSFTPLVALILFLGCEHVSQRQPFGINLLIRPFKAPTAVKRQLALLLVVCFGVVLGALLLLQNLYAQDLQALQNWMNTLQNAAAATATPESNAEPATAAIAQAALPDFSASLPWAMLMLAALQFIFNLIASHSAALVYWHGYSASKALFTTCYAFTRHWGVYLLSAFWWLIGLTGLMAVMMVLTGLLGLNPMLLLFVIQPLITIWLIVLFLSYYFSFADTYQLHST